MDIKHGIGLKDGDRSVDIWFSVQVIPAQSIQEHDEHMATHLAERIQDYSPTWVIHLITSVPRKCHLVAKTWNDSIEMWYTPQSIPKDWIRYAGIECFIAPVLE
jgi:hypothetical protein